MKRYHGVSPLEQKRRRMPAWLTKPALVIGVVIVILTIILALFPQYIAPYDPIETNTLIQNQAPSAALGRHRLLRPGHLLPGGVGYPY